MLYIIFGVLYGLQEYTYWDKPKVKTDALSIIYSVYSQIFSAIKIIFFVFNIILTMNVYNLMKKLHSFEFQRNKKNMTMIIIAYTVALIFYAITYIQSLVRHDRGDSLESIKIMWMINYQFQIPNFFMCFIMIKVKSSCDILQGLNKLDHLLMVSAFQVNKVKQFEDAKSYLDDFIASSSNNSLVKCAERQTILDQMNEQFSHRNSTKSIGDLV